MLLLLLFAHTNDDFRRYWFGDGGGESREEFKISNRSRSAESRDLDSNDEDEL